MNFDTNLIYQELDNKTEQRSKIRFKQVVLLRELPWLKDIYLFYHVSTKTKRGISCQDDGQPARLLGKLRSARGGRQQMSEGKITHIFKSHPLI